jgi:gluconate 2-dehydrogenase gamma chain
MAQLLHGFAAQRGSDWLASPRVTVQTVACTLLFRSETRVEPEGRTAVPPNIPTRRQFLTGGITLASAGFLDLSWSQVAVAAEHADHMAHAGVAGPAPVGFEILSPAEAVEVEAIASQIIPSGDLPGAREAGVVHFIDQALGTFFAAELPAFRKGLADFQNEFAAHSTGKVLFSAVGQARQCAWLHEVENTPFFSNVRRLTLLGLVALPRYGGNRDKLGWKLIGFEDRHFWQPPFGHYDADYPGFEPYPGTKPFMA